MRLRRIERSSKVNQGITETYCKIFTIYDRHIQILDSLTSSPISSSRSSAKWILESPWLHGPSLACVWLRKLHLKEMTTPIQTPNVVGRLIQHLRSCTETTSSISIRGAPFCFSSKTSIVSFFRRDRSATAAENEKECYHINPSTTRNDGLTFSYGFSLTWNGICSGFVRE